MLVIIRVINLLVTVITWLVIVKVILSYFMSPYHPIRESIDRIVEPLLAPIRRILPQTCVIDFSPLVLIILLQVLEVVLRNLLLSL